MIHQQPNTRQALCFLSLKKTNKSYSVSHQVFLFFLYLSHQNFSYLASPERSRSTIMLNQ
ncbi:hypothetical protein HanRHA438_Chr10g0463671 [Helianthus annuus]|nr:hypothetical protein HanHA89_Chr10g0392791 [Helianthus annuus]KAJ0880485.1 hypothetical protein HanRHA438_Chr10g0463671 [Helianthus annuus]KAJ0884566.1 hypothetical protein HanPSC8_Chr10g0435201 [Helianthus annuus]